MRRKLPQNLPRWNRWNSGFEAAATVAAVAKHRSRTLTSFDAAEILSTIDDIGRGVAVPEFFAPGSNVPDAAENEVLCSPTAINCHVVTAFRGSQVFGFEVGPQLPHTRNRPVFGVAIWTLD